MDDGFNWELAIDINRRALLRIVATLFSLVGLVEGGPGVETVSRRVRRAVMVALNPAESALRRLIYIKSKDLPLAFPPPKSEDKAAKTSKDKAKRGNQDEQQHPDATGGPIPVFPLFDRRKDFEGNRRRAARGRRPKFGPQIRGFNGPMPPPEPEPPTPTEDDLLNAKNLVARLRSMHRALGDLSGEAHRMMRAMGRRERRGNGMKGPMRPLYAPGHRKRHRHPVDEVLDELQTLGLWAQKIRWLNSS